MQSLIRELGHLHGWTHFFELIQMLERILIVDPMEDGEHLDGARLDFEVVGYDDQKMYPQRERIGARDVVF